MSALAVSSSLVGTACLETDEASVAATGAVTAQETELDAPRVTQAALADGMVIVAAYRGKTEVGRALVRPGDVVRVPARQCDAADGSCRQEIVLIPDESNVAPLGAQAVDIARNHAIVQQAMDQGVAVPVTTSADGSFEVVAGAAGDLPKLAPSVISNVVDAEPVTAAVGPPPALVGCADVHDGGSHWHGCYARWPDNTPTRLGNYVSLNGAGASFYPHFWNRAMIGGGQYYTIAAGPGRTIWDAEPAADIATKNCHTITVTLGPIGDSFTLCPDKLDITWTGVLYATLWRGDSHETEAAKGLSRFVIPLHTGSGFQFHAVVVSSL
jgi:translation initiation factor IF-1